MSRRSVAGLAWSIGLFAIAAAASGVYLRALNVPTLEEFLSFYAIGDWVVGTAFAAMGALIASRRPANPIGWIFLTIGLSQGFDSFDTEYAQYTMITHPGSLPGGIWMNWLREWAWAPGVGLLPLSLLLFPTGRPPSPRWRWVPWVVAVAIALLIVPVGIVLWPMKEMPSSYEALSAQGAVALQRVGGVLVGISMVASAFSVILRFGRAKGAERQQLKWLALAGALTATFVAWNFLFLTGPPEFRGFGAVIGLAVLVIMLPSIPVAVGIAILRYRLYDIDIIIRRTLIYSVLSAMLALVYFGSVVLLQGLFRALTGQQQPEIVTVISTLAIAALFAPLRRRVQDAIDRRFYRRKYDAAKTLAAFSATVRDEVDLNKLTERLLEVVQETMQPAHVSLWLKKTDRGVKR